MSNPLIPFPETVLAGSGTTAAADREAVVLKDIEVAAFIRAGQLIHAIKKVRETYDGLSLKDAKDLVEAVAERLRSEPQVAEPRLLLRPGLVLAGRTPSLTSVDGLTVDDLEAIRDAAYYDIDVTALIRAEQLIHAIKKVRETYDGLSLKDAKELVEAVAARLQQDAATANPVADNLLRSVDELELSVRSANWLQNANIRFVGDLVQKSEAELLSTKDFSRKIGHQSLHELKEILNEMGLALGLTLDHWPPTPGSPKPVIVSGSLAPDDDDDEG